MKLTKAQRHDIYKEALNELDGGVKALCCVLQSIFASRGYGYCYQGQIPYLFPEFGHKKPKNNFVKTHAIWWPGSKSGLELRKEALRACIRETAPKKRKKVSNQTKSKQ